MRPEPDSKNFSNKSAVVVLGPEYVAQLSQLNRWLLEDEGHRQLLSLAELAIRMRTWLANNYQAFGIFHDQQLIAYALIGDDNDALYLRQLFTHRDYRRQGCASALLAYVETELVRNKPLRLDVLAGNDAALKFYQKRGFSLAYYALVKDVSADQFSNY